MHHVLVYDPDGRLRSVSRTSATSPDPLLPTSLAADPGTGRLALAGAGSVALLDATGRGEARMLAYAPLPHLAVEVVVAGRDRLITTDQEEGVRAWRLAGTELVPEAATAVPGARSPILIPARGEVAVVEGQGRVRYLDAETLADVAADREFTGMPGTRLWSSADNRCHAFGGRGVVQVALDTHAAAVVALADRPPAEWVPADLAVVQAARRSRALRPLAEPLLALLRDVMRHRFGAEVGLGAAATEDGAVLEPWDVELSTRAGDGPPENR
jgi:hypothetical protein